VPVEREWLAGLLWPDRSTSQGLATLRRDRTDLRRALGPEAGRLVSPTSYSLSLDLTGAWVDLLQFDAAIAGAELPVLEQAVALYRGPLLDGWTEEWVFQERAPREQAFLRALEILAEQSQAAGELATAEGYLRRAVAADPFRDTAIRSLMAVLSARGNYAMVIQTYRDLRRRLHEELNAEPDPETTDLFQRLRAEAREKAEGGMGRQSEDRSRHPLAGSPDPSLVPSPPRPVFAARPTGTVTFLFTDIEGSSKLWEQHASAMREALARHDALLRQTIEAHGGTVFKTMGDQCCAAFASAADALAAALAGQRALQSEAWEPTGPLRVRMALHTGAAEARDGDYFGPPLNRVARLLQAGHPAKSSSPSRPRIWRGIICRRPPACEIWASTSSRAWAVPSASSRWQTPIWKRTFRP
jgi:class 3 adenylate cyclase